MKMKIFSTGKASNYPPVVKKTLIFFNIFFFSYLFIFAVCLIYITSLLSRSIGDKKANETDILIEYLTAALPNSADNLFVENIDTPMEDLFDSSMLTSFYFSTSNYPVEDDFIPYLQNLLNNYIESSNYVTGTVVYASNTNTYVSSKEFTPDSDPKMEEFLNDMIYRYNSNTLKRSQIPGRKSNTFLFQYEDKFVISKDLTTLAGTPHAIMFVFLDKDLLSSDIYKSMNSVSYKISIYDSFDNLLYSNCKEDPSNVEKYLSVLSAKDAQPKKIGDNNYIYCRSNILNLQYILEVQQDALSNNPSNPVLFYGVTILVMILLSLLMAMGLHFLLGKSTARLIATYANQNEIVATLPAKTLTLLSQKVEDTLRENLNLRKIVAVTSSEAITSLFSRLIAGQKIDDDEARITMENTNFGFLPNDIYIAGILYHTSQDFLSVENRYRILNLLTVSFQEIKKTNEVNICAFPYDVRTIAIIASFPAGTSIAKGKAKVNAMKEKINETLSYSNNYMLLAFGNMYSSILDLSFSYNEAFRGIHYMTEAVSVSQATVSTTYLEQNTYETEQSSIDQLNQVEVTENTDAIEGTELSPQEFLELIYRRTEQIAKLVWDEKDDQVKNLISRTIKDIIQNGNLLEQTNNCKRLVSAVTSHMLSYPFVSDSHLSDVYNIFSLQLKEKEYSFEDLKQYAEDALFILCNDFSEALKKQRNPYIMAAQDYITQNYSNPELTLESIAEYLKIAPNYLSTIFSKNLGKRLFEYINEYRLEKSIELLLTSDKSINDIGEECGFGSSRNYIRIFKKRKGLPPGVYRKQHTEQRSASNTEEDTHEKNDK